MASQDFKHRVSSVGSTPFGIIGLCGDSGAGKDTFAEPFHNHGFRQYAFANPLKEACAHLYGINIANFHRRELKNERIPYWNKTPTEMAQFVGTELVREHLGESHWISRLNYQMVQDANIKEEFKAVISDVRFQNEAQWILSMGGILIRLTRPGNDGNVGIPNHPSKNGINWETLVYPIGRNSVFHVINSGTIAELHQEAEKFIRCQVAQ
jgi:hypothetical protein